MRSLSIAGITFRIRTEGSLPLAPPHAAYREFVDRPPAPGDLTVEVTCRPEADRTDFSRLHPVVRGAESWDLYAEAEDVVFVMRGAAGTREPLWTARCDRGGTRVEIGTSLRLPGPRGGELLTNCLQYPLDQLLVMRALGGDGFVVHAGGAMPATGGALLYGGVSGAGKTTLSRLIESRPGWSVLSDDRVVIRPDRDGQRIWGTPWPGEGGQARNSSAPLRALLFLTQGQENRLAPLAPPAALRRLLPLVSIPWYDRVGLSAPLDRCGALVEEIPSFELTFTPDAGAALLLEEFRERLAPA